MLYSDASVHGDNLTVTLLLLLLLGQNEVSQFLGDKLRRRHALLGDGVEAEEAVGQAGQDVDLDLQ